MKFEVIEGKHARIFDESFDLSFTRTDEASEETKEALEGLNKTPPHLFHFDLRETFEGIANFTRKTAISPFHSPRGTTEMIIRRCWM